MTIAAMTSSAAAAQPPAAGALDAAWQRLRARGPRSAGYVFVLCLVIGTFLTVMEGRGFGSHLIYSFAVGGCCWLLVDGSRLVLAALTDAWRRARGQPLDAAGFGSGWRGVIPSVLLSVLFGPALGLWSTASNFASPLLPLLAWGLALGAGVLLGRRLPAPAGTAWDGARLLLPGSAIPLVIIITIFLLRYVGSIALVMHPAWRAASEVALPMAAAFGLIGGVLLGRSLGLLALTRRPA